jgi:hypothetical protein
MEISHRLAALKGSPQQQMRIEKKLQASLPHSRSISELRIRSKSSGTSIRPCMKPSRQTRPAIGASSERLPFRRLPDKAREMSLGLVDVGLHRAEY